MALNPDKIEVSSNEDGTQLRQILDGLVRRQAEGKSPILLRRESAAYIPSSDGLSAFKAEKTDIKLLLEKHVFWADGRRINDKGETETYPTKLQPNVLHTLMKRLPPEIWPFKGALRLPYLDWAVSDEPGRMRLVERSGFDPQNGYFLAPAHELQEGASVAFDDAKQAWEFLRRDWLHDFDTVDAESEAHLCCMLLHPYLQRLFSRAPLYLIDAYTQSSAKTLLAEVHMIAVTGHAQTSKWSETRSENEYSFGGELLRGEPVIVLDNAEGLVRSPLLANILTTGNFIQRGRVGQPSYLVSAAVQWIMTSNNAELDRDLRERSVQVRIDQSSAAARGGPFFHPHLPQWTKRNRALIIEACLTILREVFFSLRLAPPPAPRFAKFEIWRDVMWAVCSHLGLGDMLRTDRQLVSQDASSEAMGNFYRICLATFGSEPVTAAQVASLLDRVLEAQPGSDWVHLPFAQVLLKLPKNHQLAAQALGVHFRKTLKQAFGDVIVTKASARKGYSRYAFRSKPQ